MCILCESDIIVVPRPRIFLYGIRPVANKSFVPQILDKLGATALMHADLLTCLFANLCLFHSLRFVVRVHHTLTLLPSPFRKKTSEE